MDEASIKARRARLAELNLGRKAAEAAKLDELLAPYLNSQPPSQILEQVQFRHDTFLGNTYAVMPPTVNTLIQENDNLLNGLRTDVEFWVGVATLNAEDKDQYNKKIGRIVSASNLTKVFGELDLVVTNAERTIYTVKVGNTNFSFMLTHSRVVPFLSHIWSTVLVTPYSERLRNSHKR